jgi:DNA-binding response OmpR family regulator
MIGCSANNYWPITGRPSYPGAIGERSMKTQRAVHLLVVEDEQILCHFLRTSLQAAGYIVFTAQNEQEALEILQSVSIDLMLLDVNLGESDSYHLCETLRNVGTTPIILLSGRHTPEDMLLGFSVGADDFIAKPFQLREIEARIQRLLHRMQARRQTGYGHPAVQA